MTAALTDCTFIWSIGCWCNNCRWQKLVMLLKR